ncbi:hypothetical protein ACSFA7_19350 [Variovorax sp. LT1R20]|uniref:hypothetical protein n=1 Tax=Variovorax sp. LT1R20 TaxID=3443729 RepID=UPI003F4830AD
MNKLACRAVVTLLMTALASCGGGGGGESAMGLPQSRSISEPGATSAVAAKAELQDPSGIQGLSATQADSLGGVAALHGEGLDVLSARAQAVIPSQTLPSLLAPQPGSTAAVGKIGEGLYEHYIGGLFRNGYGFVGSDGTVALRSSDFDAVFGSITMTTVNWTYNPDAHIVYASGFGPERVTGSGTFTPNSSMQGNWEGAIPSIYSASNALAVSQSSVAGIWVGEDIYFSASITVDEKGAFKGTTTGRSTAQCDISGAIEQFQPGTAKNMFKVSVRIPYSPYCNLGYAYTGLGGIYQFADGRYTVRWLRLLVRGHGREWFPLNLKRQS